MGLTFVMSRMIERSQNWIGPHEQQHWEVFKLQVPVRG